MLQIIRKGDKTTHGGSVMTASETMKIGGLGVARKGDMVSCPTAVGELVGVSPAGSAAAPQTPARAGRTGME